MIISFYSYKGGVGRTQLTANLASYLCYYKKRKVLIIDWDMEAPGVDYFFKLDRSIIKTGLLDLFKEFVATVRNKENITEHELPKIFENKNSKYILNLIKSERHDGRVDLIPAGNYNKDFNKDASSFDWFNFHETHNGKFFIEYLKEELNNSEYDYVFIDSRTGSSDYSGICNIQLPEMNVFVIAPTFQNFNGSKEIYHSIVDAPYIKNGMRNPIVMPILSRLDRTDKESGVWFGRFRETFKETIISFFKYSQKVDLENFNDDEIEETLNKFIDRTLLEYKTEISYGEKLLFFDDMRKIEYTTLEKQILEISKLIEGLNTKVQDEKQAYLLRLISEGRLENVFEYLLFELNEYQKRVPDYSISNLYDTLLILAGKFIGNQQDKLMGVFKKTDFHNEKARIGNSLLKLIDSLPTDFFANASSLTGTEKNNLVNNEKPDISSDFEYDIFLAFSSKDIDEVRPISIKLKEYGLKVFFSDDNLRVKEGVSFLETISSALENSKHFVLFCTPNAMQSKYVKLEYETFFTEFARKDHENRKFIIFEGRNFNINLIPLIFRSFPFCSSVSEIIDSLSTPSV